jgi:hypothetical protein
MRLFLPYVLYKVRCLSKSYAHINNCKKQLGGKKERKKKRKNSKKQKEKHNSTD